MMTMTQNASNNAKLNLSQPRLFSHLNGLAFFIGTLVLYGIFSGDWLAFILLLFVPDVSMVGYLVNKRIGAWLYNIVHSFALAIAVMIAGYGLGIDSIISIGLIMMAHIAMDHALGFGYKYADADFSETHIQRL